MKNWKRMKLVCLIAVVAASLASLMAQAPNAAPSQWDKPAADLADQIAAILGPGQARLTIRNVSSLATDEIPAIRRLLEQNLKAHGVIASGAESANTIRVTLSEDVRERLWVAEVAEGSVTRVAMVGIQHSQAPVTATTGGILLRKERFPGPFELTSLPCISVPDGKPPLLAVAERPHGLVVLKQGCLLALDKSPAGFSDGRTFDNLGSAKAQTRDPRGLVVTDADDDGFHVYLPGTECTGNFTVSSKPDRPPGEGWSLHCHSSDDPWPILNAGAADGASTGSPVIKAFYNAARDYFTGVVTPSVGVDLPAFYSAALVPRAASGTALLIGGIDGKVQLAEGGVLKPVSGTRDWGSDFAALKSGCGGGTQMIATSSGEAASDSLRAYELPAQEAVPASAPLAMDGTVTALWTAADGKSVLAVVRGADGEYEVVRVTAGCD
jgi:hypothetical protein